MNGVGLLANLVQALGWCLVHFVWQAALIGLVYGLARMVLSRGNPRYLAAMLGLLALALLPAWTFWHALNTLRPAGLSLRLASVMATPLTALVADGAPWQRGMAIAQAALPWLVLVWFAAVALLAARIVHQWLGLCAIVRNAEPVEVLAARAQRLAAQLGLGRAIRLLGSAQLATPALVGWLRPVVVLPLAVFARMPAAQVDLILAHELAHLRRIDPLANLFQVILETVFFYHPVVHWISRDARNERELCCDRLALQASGGNRREFVAALANLEVLRGDAAGLVLAASGGVLAERARFIAGVPGCHRPGQPGRTAALVALLALAVVAVAVPRWQTIERPDAAPGRADSTAAVAPVTIPRPLADSATPSRATVTAYRHVRQAAALQVGADGGGAASPLTLAAVAGPQLPMALSAAALVTRPWSAPERMASPPLAVVATLPAAVAEPLAAPEPAVVPRVLKSVAPEYPRDAAQLKLAGEVVVEFSLSGRGVPRDLRIAKSNSPELDAAALAAILQWRFAPIQSGQQRFQQPFTFQLDAASGDAASPACLTMTGTHICRTAAAEDSSMRAAPTPR